MQSPFMFLHNQAGKLLEFQNAVQQEAWHRYKKFLQGYIRYKQIQSSPRKLLAPIIKQIGSASLIDYGALYGASPNAKPVLVIPSLINKSYIFDLCSGFSLFEHMTKHQLRPFLIDWGQQVESGQSHFESLLNTILFPFAETIQDYTSQKQVSLAGYCMGGLFALAAACHRRNDFDRIALMATPWDFHAGKSTRQQAFLLDLIHHELDLRNHVSAFCLQLLFHFLDPTAGIRKFSTFADIKEEAPAYDRFVALEQWVNDIVPLPRSLSEEVFGKCYRDNIFALSKSILGKQIDPTISTLMILAEKDRIVPTPSAAALKSLLPQAQSLTVPLGHVGLLVSQQAKNLVWQPLVDWLK